MAMTTSQRRRLLGAICEGLSTESAADYAGVTLSELEAEYDRTSSFRDSRNLAAIVRDAEQVRDTFLECMERLQE
jgi:hypothetical protein